MPRKKKGELSQEAVLKEKKHIFIDDDTGRKIELKWDDYVKRPFNAKLRLLKKEQQEEEVTNDD